MCSILFNGTMDVASAFEGLRTAPGGIGLSTFGCPPGIHPSPNFAHIFAHTYTGPQTGSQGLGGRVAAEGVGAREFLVKSPFPGRVENRLSPEISMVFGGTRPKI